MTENENLLLNRLIMTDATINGMTDCTGTITIYYNVNGHYVVVLVEEYTGKCWYRIFECPGEFTYKRYRVLDPEIGCEDLRCMYDYFEDFKNNNDFLIHKEPGNWAQDLVGTLQNALFEAYDG